MSNISTQITLDSLKENLSFFNKMYDAVRLVDPLHKKVLDKSLKNLSATLGTCYDYWENDKICDNCISIRASQNNKSFVKLEYQPGEVIMVTAIPIEMDNSAPVVLELLKNATDSLVLGELNGDEELSLTGFVAEFNDKAVRDKLTSLYNRRFIDERLPVDIVNAVISNSPLSVGFFDLDNLKTINDVYGHKAGDRVLALIGKEIKKAIRHSLDWAARYGGDEFILCMSNATKEEAQNICKRISNAIKNKAISIDGNNINLSVSYGLCTMDKERLTADEVIHIADKKMYHNKKMKKARMPR